MPHSCNYFCTPPLHAYPLLARPGFTAERIIASYARHGKRIECVVPAREADIPAWQKICTHAWTEMGSEDHRIAIAPPYATMPWVVFLRAEEREP